MEQYLPIIKQCPLFFNIGQKDLTALMACLSVTQKHYDKNNFIFTTGEDVRTVGVVLSGSVHIILEDFWGNRTILAGIEVSGLFGEAFSCAGTKKMPVSVIANKPSDILFCDYNKIITTCPSACSFHLSLIKNMLKILAQKNIQLMQKIDFLSQPSTREKLLAYLSYEAKQAQCNQFDIPFNRQELAEYLSVDRSAMSSELSKMRADGLLAYHRSHFELKKSYHDE